MIDEARRGEELGFGSAFISERWNVKEASSLVGAACAVTSRTQIVTAATNHNTRHPLITASWATTMHRLLRRAVHARHRPRRGRDVRGVRDTGGYHRANGGLGTGDAPALARGGHRQPRRSARQLPGAVPRSDFNEDIRLAIVAFGPNTLALGGRVFDDVILDTYFTPEALQRCVTTVKDAAEKAGRDPDNVRVWSCFATIGDHLPESYA